MNLFDVALLRYDRTTTVITDQLAMGMCLCYIRIENTEKCREHFAFESLASLP